MSFAKIHRQLLLSSIWGDDPWPRLVWVTLLMLADRYGNVTGAVTGIAHTARVPLQETVLALQAFQAPDPHSSNREFEGRRIKEISGGWHILNHGRYRELGTSEETREKTAERVRRYRERNGVKRPVTHANAGNGETPSEADTEADTEAEADLRSEKKLLKTAADLLTSKPREERKSAAADFIKIGKREEETLRVLAETIQATRGFGELDALAIAGDAMGVMRRTGWPAAVIVKAIRDCRAKTVDGLTREALHSRLAGFIANAGNIRGAEVSGGGAVASEAMTSAGRAAAAEMRDRLFRMIGGKP